MSTVHQVLQARRPHAVPVIRPAILATMAYLFLLFVGWIQRMVLSPWEQALQFDAGLLLMLRAAAICLIAWVGYDCWQGREVTGRMGAWVVAAFAVAALVGSLWFLSLLAGLPAA